MKVPHWFELLGSKYDKTLAKELDVPIAHIAGVRGALGIQSYRQERLKSGYLLPAIRWKKYLRLRRQKIPQEFWPSALGFIPKHGLTAAECMEEWLFCNRKGLYYNPRFAQKPRLRRKVYKAKASHRKHQAPKGDASLDLAERDDETFNVGDV